MTCSNHCFSSCTCADCLRIDSATTTAVTLHTMIQIGFVTVVWNDACDSKVFQLDVTLPDDTNSDRNSITTVPCSQETAQSPACMWMAAVKTEARDEYDSNEEYVYAQNTIACAEQSCMRRAVLCTKGDSSLALRVCSSKWRVGYSLGSAYASIPSVL
jgi:hypothetical protein